MAVQALGDESERGHLVGDIPALLLVAVVLAYLSPRTPKSVWLCQFLKQSIDHSNSLATRIAQLSKNDHIFRAPESALHASTMRIRLVNWQTIGSWSRLRWR